MPKAKKKKYNAESFWFLAIIIVSVIGVTLTSKAVVWSILGICGAVVAYKNIKKKEENCFLIGTSALLIVIMMFLLVPEFYSSSLTLLKSFLVNLGVGLGVASFVVALGLIARLGLD
jgi:predicted nucleic acid-binding Zn ribbon protein